MENRITKMILNALRKISYLNIHRKRVTEDCRVERGKYQCAKCQGVFKRTEIHMDHINPVVDPNKGFNGDFNEYIKKLFYGELQALCIVCHKQKTKEENVIRKNVREDKSWQEIP